ncbi:MAG: class I SAM-dependent methyltransferase [Sandaracinaceae bacterium]
MFHPDGPTFWELAEQALSSTERGYDLLAPKFDRTPFRTPDALLEAVVGEIDGPVDRALDVCCGTGAAMRWLRPRCRAAVVGVDRSRGMLEEAARRLVHAPGDAAVRLVRADALDLPFEGAFDLVTCFGAFGHILERDEPRFVDRIARALVPGGRFVFVTSRRPPPLHPLRLAAAGFNLAMRVRNALIDPPFVMYYLTFLLPEVRALLEARGFLVEVRSGRFAPPVERAELVVATRRPDEAPRPRPG